MVAVLALLLAAAPADLAVLDVKTGAGVDPTLGPYLTQVIAAEVALRTSGRPMVKDDIKALLGFEAARQRLGCEGDACLAEIAGALGVARVLDASVSASGEHYLVTAAILDTRKAQAMARATELSARDTTALVAAVRSATAQLFTDEGSRKANAERDSRGATEAGARKATGTEARSADASRGRSPTVQPQLEARPAQRSLSRTGWAAIAGGAAVALAAGGVAFGVSSLSAAHDADAGIARRRAHVADIFYVGALLGAGSAIYLWRTDDARASAAVTPAPAGARLALEVRW